jgi:molecular chaperone DnaK (HSP70)
MQHKASTSVDLSAKYPNKLEEAPHYEKKARDLAIDYLTSVRKHVIKELRKKYGRTALDTLEVEWIITVPAVWSPEAKHATRECAEAAGMGKGDTLLMTSEPEAAAVFALKRLEPHNIKVGNNIVICDAGGGTVDLVTYRIESLHPDLKVEESGICSGGKCGSVFLNRVFEHMVEKRLGGKSLSDDAMAEMRKQWEYFVSFMVTCSPRHFMYEESVATDIILPDQARIRRRGRG